jgi:tRNA threonylcarbamoyladenosine biosynthesis protein TsaE
MQRRSESAEEFRTIAAAYVRSLLSGAKAVLVTLSGELGAGKTTFVQSMAKSLGVEDVVTSPTYVIEKVYRLTNQKWQRLIHIDAYRLHTTEDLAVIHWDELLADSGNLIVLEWPEKVADAIPTDAISLRFDIDGDARIINGIHGQEI